MGFFASFWNWLSTQLSGYVGSNTAILAGALEPTRGRHGYALRHDLGRLLQMTGRIEEPVMTGVRRIVLLAVVLGAVAATMALQQHHRRHVLYSAVPVGGPAGWGE